MTEGCSALAEVKGLCNKRYNSWRKTNGSVEVEPEAKTHFTKCVKKTVVVAPSFRKPRCRGLPLSKDMNGLGQSKN
jgi:hypothetical protein